MTAAAHVSEGREALPRPFSQLGSAIVRVRQVAFAGIEG